MFSFEPKNERNYSALASKMSQIKKTKAFYLYYEGVFGKIEALLFYLTPFRSLGRNQKNIFARFLVQMKKKKIRFWNLLTFRYQSFFKTEMYAIENAIQPKTRPPLCLSSV